MKNVSLRVDRPLRNIKVFKANFLSCVLKYGKPERSNRIACRNHKLDMVFVRGELQNLFFQHILADYKYENLNIFKLIQFNTAIRSNYCKDVIEQS
jgi:hypothetical protein